MKRLILSAWVLFLASAAYGFTTTGSTPVNVINSTSNPVNVSLQGTITIGSATINASNPSVSLYGTPIPSSGTAVGAENPSGKLIPFQVDASSSLLVNCVTGCSGSGGSGNTPVATFGQPIISTGVPIGGIGPTGNFQTFAVNSSSAVKTEIVNVATVTVSGQVVTSTHVITDAGSVTSASQGTSPWITSGTVTNTVNVNCVSGCGGSVTTGPIQVLVGVSTTTVGYGVGLASVPVNVLNTITAAISGTPDVNLAQIGGSAQSGANVVDAGNSALRVNVVTGGTGGGPSQIQVKSSAGTDTYVGYQTAGSSVPVKVLNAVDVNCLSGCNGTSTTGPEQILVGVSTTTVGYGVGLASVPVNVLNTVAVSGTVTANQGTAGNQKWPVAAYIDTSSNTVQVSNTVNVACLSGCGSGSSGPEQILVGISTTTVGYGVGLASVPVNVLNTVNTTVTNSVTVTGTVTANQGTAGSQKWPVSAYIDSSSNTVQISGTVNVDCVTGCSGGGGSVSVNYGSPMTSSGVPVAFINDAGNAQAARVDVSSNLYVAQTTPSNLKVSAYINGSSNTVTANQGTAGSAAWPVSASINGSSNTVVATQGTLPWQVVGGTMSVLINGSSNTVTANQGTSPWTIGSSSASALMTAYQGGAWSLSTTAPPLQNVNLTQIDTVTVVTGGVDGTLAVGGNTSTGTAVSLSSVDPVLIGGPAYNTVLTTQTTNGAVTYASFSPDGAMLVNLDCPRSVMVSTSVTLSNSSTETLLFSSGTTGVYNDLVNLIIDNTSSTNTRLDFRSSGNGTAIYFAVQIPATQDVRGIAPSHRIPQKTAASNWTVQAATGVTDVRIFAWFCPSK